MPEHNEHHLRQRRNRSAGLAALGVGLVAIGGVAGAVVMAETRPSVSMAPVKPVAIGSLSSNSIVTIRGRVADVYGNKFVMGDGTGRALVDTGREGDERRLVAVDQPVTVQGRFERGFVHAAFLIGPDNKVLALGPLARPPHGPHDGPDRGPGVPPPPPPGTNEKAPPPASAAGDAGAASSPSSDQSR